MKFFINDFFSKNEEIRKELLKKPLMENFIFCAANKCLEFITCLRTVEYT